MSSQKRSTPSRKGKSQKDSTSQSRSSERKLQTRQRSSQETGADALLPANLRDAPEEQVDSFVNSELDKFDLALGYCDAGNDPVRRMLARVSLRLAIDPRIHEREVRARSGAILNTAKTLGLDRDLVRANTDEKHVESVLARIRDAAHKGIESAGRQFKKGDGSSHSEMPAGQEVLLRSTPEGGERTVEIGPVRTTLSNSSEDSRSDRFGQGGGPTHEIDCIEEPSS